MKFFREQLKEGKFNGMHFCWRSCHIFFIFPEFSRVFLQKFKFPEFPRFSMFEEACMSYKRLSVFEINSVCNGVYIPEFNVAII